MKDISISLCDLCGLPLHMGGEYRGELNKSLEIRISLAHSKGQSFCKTDYDASFSGEVCLDCFNALYGPFEKVRGVIRTRKGINKPKPHGKKMGFFGMGG